MSTSADTTDAMAAIEAMAARLRDEYGAEAVILYGSRADGSARPDSDVDLMIIKDGVSDYQEHVSKVRSFLADLRGGLYLDVHIYTPEQVKRTLAKGDHFVQDVILKGMALQEGEGFDRYLGMALKSYNMSPQESEYPDAWSEIADGDYTRASRLLNLTDSKGAGFFLHQSLENFFKAYLIRQGWRARREHNLENLLDYALRYDRTLESYREACEFLNVCYLAQLYPHYLWKDGFPNPPDASVENVRAALAEITPLIERLRAGSERTDIDGQDG